MDSFHTFGHQFRLTMAQTTSPAELYQYFKKHPHISTDSRNVMPGSIFFALKGENFDGNQYAHAALEQGAVYAVTDDPGIFGNEKILLVRNVLEALQQLSMLHRNTLNIPVIGITGSNGKTTTKELLAAALTAKFKVLATPGNLNNHIGVPLTLLSIRPEHEIGVVEMGANHIGEIAALCELARPTHGIITNIGKAHLEGFGGPEGVIKAKSELYNFLRTHEGSAFVYADDPLLMKLSDGIQCSSYGQNERSDYRGFPVIDPGDSLKVKLQDQEVIQTQLPGMYNFPNIMAAYSIALHFGVDEKSVVDALENYKPRMNRSQLLKTEHNILLLDAYNANPSSMEAALQHFVELPDTHKLLLLGDMFELGDSAKAEHEHILRLASSMKVEQIYTAGPLFVEAARQFPAVNAFESTEALQKELTSQNLRNKTILIKGSRGMKMEQLVAIF